MGLNNRRFEWDWGRTGSCCARDYDVILTALEEAPLLELAQNIQRCGRRTQVVSCDLSSPSGAERLAQACSGYEVEVLINDAGYGLAGMFTELGVERQSGRLT